MNLDKRLDKVSRSLNPKQAVVLFLQEIQPIQNVYELIHYIKGLPEPPMTRITRQIGEAVRESMKGQPKETVNAAVRRAVKDVVFLIKLQHQVNYKVMLEEKTWSLTQAYLAESFDNMRQGVLFPGNNSGYRRKG